MIDAFRIGPRTEPRTHTSPINLVYWHSILGPLQNSLCIIAFHKPSQIGPTVILPPLNLNEHMNKISEKNIPFPILLER